jgi:hypothetical protein
LSACVGQQPGIRQSFIVERDPLSRDQDEIFNATVERHFIYRRECQPGANRAVIVGMDTQLSRHLCLQWEV